MIFFIVCILAGLGAGMVTGLAGLSAAIIIAPLLVTLLKFDPYIAVGIALASDVLASAAAALIYKRRNHIDIKNGFYMMLTTIIFTAVGSYLATLIPSNTMGHFTRYITICVGIRFIIKPVIKPSTRHLNRSKRKNAILSLLAGVIVGLTCGVFGAGGGLTMLFILTSLLGYDLKTAVGTSTFIMAFTALTGAITHYAFDTNINFIALGLCVGATLVGSLFASLFANKIKSTTLNRIVGIVIAVIGITLLVLEYSNAV